MRNEAKMWFSEALWGATRHLVREFVAREFSAL